MIPKRILIQSILAFLTLLSFAGTASAGNVATIILKNGEQYDDVAYNINNLFKTVDLEVAGEGDITKKSVSFSDIEAIVDSDGYNLAPDLLGGWYRPIQDLQSEDSESEEEDIPTDIGLQSNDTTGQSSENVKPVPPSDWKSENHPVHTRARLPRWNFGVRLGSSFGIPVGKWYDGVNAGIGFESDLLIPVSSNIVLRFHFSRAGLKVDDDFIVFPYSPAFRIIERESNISVLRYLALVQYHRPFIEKKQGIASFYTSAGLGAISHNMNGKITLEELSTGDLYLIEGEDNMTDFLISSIIGFTYSVSPNLGFDVSVSIDYPFIGVENELAEAYIIDFKLGLLLFL